MTCTYCGNLNHNHSLNGDCVCFDCHARLHGTPPAERQAKLLGDLQLVHAAVLRLDPSSTLRQPWLDELTNRMAWARVAKFTLDESAESAVGALASLGVSPETAQRVDEILGGISETAAALRSHPAVAPTLEPKRTGSIKIRRRA